MCLRAHLCVSGCVCVVHACFSGCVPMCVQVSQPGLCKESCNGCWVHSAYPLCLIACMPRLRHCLRISPQIEKGLYTHVCVCLCAIMSDVHTYVYGSIIASRVGYVGWWIGIV